MDLVAVGDTKAKVNTTNVLGADIVGTLPGFPIPSAPKGEWIVAYTGMTQEGITTPAEPISSWFERQRFTAT